MIPVKIIERDILPKAVYRIVGSVLYSKNPRDFDVIGICKDTDFEKFFEISTETFKMMLQSGEWSDEMWKWSSLSTSVSKKLSKRIQTRLGRIDFRFVPESMVIDP